MCSTPFRRIGTGRVTLASGERGCLPDDAGQKEIVLKTADIRDISRYGQKKVLLMCTEPSGLTFHVMGKIWVLLDVRCCSLRDMERATFTTSGARPKVLEEGKKGLRFFPTSSIFTSQSPRTFVFQPQLFFSALSVFPTKGTFFFLPNFAVTNWTFF